MPLTINQIKQIAELLKLRKTVTTLPYAPFDHVYNDTTENHQFIREMNEIINERIRQIHKTGKNTLTRKMLLEKNNNEAD